ncbi:MAG: PHP domain-containing protein, partial [Acidimicrobiia bacterium]|nr:PHP domain-containing protein [Acidimicrobiia bacterium]
MADSFAHLHLHTEYSMLDGAARVDQVVAAAARDGQPAIGITDHGNLYGVLPFYKAAEAQGLKPIIGMEGYFVTCSRHDRPKRDENKRYHMTLLAETTEGYKNLVRISSDAFIDGYYYKPRLDFDLLERFHTGLIGTTGCLGGVVSQHLLKGDEQGALEAAGTFQDILGRDNFFVEMMSHGLVEQKQVNPGLLRIAKQVKAPLLATNDSHYTTAEDAEAHDALLCVQTGSLKSDKDRFKFDSSDYYLKSARQMRDLFDDIPDACDNTLWIAERSDVKLSFGDPVLPNYPLPDGFADEAAYLR